MFSSPREFPKINLASCAWLFYVMMSLFLLHLHLHVSLYLLFTVNVTLLLYG